MPISQQRLIDLSAAAKGFLERFRTIKQQASLIIEHYDQGQEFRVPQLVAELSALLAHPSTQLDPDHIETLTREIVAAKYTRARNQRAAAYQRLRRGAPLREEHLGYASQVGKTLGSRGPQKHPSYTVSPNAPKPTTSKERAAETATRAKLLGQEPADASGPDIWDIEDDAAVAAETPQGDLGLSIEPAALPTGQELLAQAEAEIAERKAYAAANVGLDEAIKRALETPKPNGGDSV